METRFRDVLFYFYRGWVVFFPEPKRPFPYILVLQRESKRFLLEHIGETRRWNMRCRGNCCKGEFCCRVGQYAVTFGLGLVCSCFFPVGLIMFVVAVILVVLGIALLRSGT